MSRQSQVNSFNDGLNKDLNPLLTPNTVMTDCLNGTIVTYNGNEFALQNDLGNYKFKFGSLSDGYVPVGIKEYANTLYIISYNPIEDMVEIGSFPSMKAINKAEINTYGENRSEKIELVVGKDNLYSKIQNNSQLTMLSSLDEDYKLNPGDGYILEKFNEDGGDVIKESDDLLLWQHTATYILTENGKLYNIDAFVEYTTERKTYIPKDFKSVKWDVPGWFALKVVPNVMSEFNCYITDINFEPNDSGTITTNAEIKLQSIWDSNIYNRRFASTNGRIIDKIKERLGYIIEFVGGRPEDKIVNPIENLITTYNDIYTVIHETVNISTTEYTQVKITPFLIVDDNNTRIIYDQFTTYVNLEQRSFNSEDVKFGETVFKYYVGDKGLTLNFDLVAPVGSSISYNLKRYVEPIGNITYDDGITGFEYVYKDHIKEDDIVYNGQNIITLKFTNPDEESYKRSKYSENSEYKRIGSPEWGAEDPNGFKIGDSKVVNQTFDKEDYYELEVFIHPENYKIENYKGEKDPLCKRETRVIYASEIVNYYQKQYDNYWSDDEFKLNAEAFADAAQRMLTVNNVIKGLGHTPDDVYIDYNGNVVDSPDNLIDAFLSSTPSVSDDPIYTETKNVGYGKRYKWNKPEKLFNLPKNQYNVIGRIWRGFNEEAVEESILATTNKNETITVSSDGNDYFVDALSKSYISFATEIISLSYPNENQTVKIYGQHIDKISDHKYRINNAVFLGVLNKDSCVHSKYSSGLLTMDREVLFDVIDSETVNITDGNGNFTFKFRDGHWTDDYSGLHVLAVCDLFHFNHSASWASDAESRTATKALNSNIKGPSLVVMSNNFCEEESWRRYFWGLESYRECEFGFDLPNPMPDKITGSDKRNFISIVIPKMKEDSDDYPYIMLPYMDYDTEDDKYQYFVDVICNFFLIVDAVKYCKATSIKNKYYPIANIKEQRNNAIIIKDITYLLSNIIYKYPRYIDTEDKNVVDLSVMSNIIYEYNEAVNIKLTNNIEDVFSSLKKQILDFNAKVTKDNEGLNSYSSVNSNQMFIDIRHDTENDILLNMLNVLDYSSSLGKLTVSDAEYGGFLRTLNSFEGVEEDDGHNLAKIKGVLYNEV